MNHKTITRTLRFTTVALSPGQSLSKQSVQSFGVETYCIGYTNGKRDGKLDGYYYTKELKLYTSNS